jgi:hypothetical protein
MVVENIEPKSIALLLTESSLLSVCTCGAHEQLKVIILQWALLLLTHLTALGIKANLRKVWMAQDPYKDSKIGR